MGDEAGTAITTGDNNTLIGYVAGDAISTSSANTAVGSFAMTSMTDGADNVAVGTSALDAKSAFWSNPFCPKNNSSTCSYVSLLGMQAEPKKLAVMAW